MLLKKRHKAFAKNIGLEWPFKTVQDKYQIEVKTTGLQIPGWFSKISFPFLFGFDIEKKSNAILTHFNDSARNYGSDFYINFASANYHGMFIWRISSVTNKVIFDHFKTNSKTNIGSIVVMDFPNRIPGLVETLIQHNFYTKSDAVIRL